MVFLDRGDGCSRPLGFGAVVELIGSVRDGEQLGFRGNFYALQSLFRIMGFDPIRRRAPCLGWEVGVFVVFGLRFVREKIWDGI